MRKLSIWLGGWLLALSMATASADAGLTVGHTWINEAPPNAAALAGYMVVSNGGEKPRVLVGARSPLFASVMLHRTIIKDGMARMVHQEAIRIPPGGSVTFEPNGYHLMLMKPKRHLKAGDKVAVTLEFKDGTTVPLTFEVRRGQGMPMREHGGQMNMGQ